MTSKNTPRPVSPPSSSQYGVTPRTNLHNLPLEITDIILSYLDRTSILAMARVARSIPLDIRPHIWRELVIAVPPKPYQFVHPLCRDTYSPPNIAWVGPFGPYSYEYPGDVPAYTYPSLELRRRAETIILRSTEPTLRSVRSVIFRPLPGSHYGIVRLLQLVSSNLTSLAIELPEEDGAVDSQEDACGVFMWRLLRASKLPDSHTPFFPALTHLTIGKGTISDACSIPSLCRLAPNLKSLDLSIQQLTPASRAKNAIFTGLTAPTKIRILRIYFEFARPRRRRSYDPADSDAFAAILSVVHWSRVLRCLTVEVEDMYGFSAHAYMLGAVNRLKCLTDFYWAEEGDISVGKDHPRLVETGKSGEQGDGESGVRRLVIPNHETFLERPIKVGPFAANLEVLHVWCSITDVSRDEYCAPAVEPLFSADLTSWLAAAPQLHTINLISWRPKHSRTDIFPRLDAIEQSGAVTMQVRSLRHGDSELLQLRILLQPALDHESRWYEPFPGNDTCVGFCRRGQPYQRKHSLYMHAESSRPVPDHRQIYSCYDGISVPPSVIERMRKAEGASEEDWDRRGVQVSGAAWDVLAELDVAGGLEAVPCPCRVEPRW